MLCCVQVIHVFLHFHAFLLGPRGQEQNFFRLPGILDLTGEVRGTRPGMGFFDISHSSKGKIYTREIQELLVGGFKYGFYFP